MTKNTIISITTVLLLPLGILASAAMVAFMLAALTIFSPVIFITASLSLAHFCAKLIADYFFHKNFFGPRPVSLQEEIITHTLTLTFAVLFFIPLTLVLVLLTIVFTPLFFLALAIVLPFQAAEYLVNKMDGYIESKEFQQSLSSTCQMLWSLVEKSPESKSPKLPKTPEALDSDKEQSDDDEEDEPTHLVHTFSDTPTHSSSRIDSAPVIYVADQFKM